MTLPGSQLAGTAPALEGRPPERVCALPRLGALHPTRLSFARTLLRRMSREGWRVECERFEVDAEGVGIATYAVHTPQGPLGFVAFSDHLPSEERTDRVIAERWDASFALLRSPADASAIARLARNVPRQEAGRVSPDELVLSRANRSVRLFDHVVGRLAAGRQPDARALAEVGYLMRTTAVYGNGKFGLCDLERLQSQGVFRLPFQAEMLTVYLARGFSLDLVTHLAAARAPRSAVALSRALARGVGVGNATGLGMAPFLVNHPKLLHRWLWVREEALARVRAREAAAPRQAPRLLALLARARAHVAQWLTADVRQRARIETLGRELRAVARRWQGAGPALLAGPFPFEHLWQSFSGQVSQETEELLVALLLEVNGDRVDDLEECTGCDETEALDAAMTVAELIALIERNYAWALEVDFDAAQSLARFWYVSEDKEEPRLGERGVDAGVEREMRIDVARQVQSLHRRLRASEGPARSASVARWLLEEPSQRGVVRRVQSLADEPFAEVRANLLDADCVAVDLLRAKLATFGAGRFDPKSDRWIRITLFQGAPLADELDDWVAADDWWMPVAAGDAT
jgi:hypothetical protein